MSTKIIVGVLVAFVATVFILRDDLSEIINSEVSTQPYNFEANVEQVDNISIEFTGNGVELTVKLNRQMTCDQLVEALEIQPFLLKDKTYYPVCSTVKNKTIKVVYRQYSAI